MPCSTLTASSHSSLSLSLSLCEQHAYFRGLDFCQQGNCSHQPCCNWLAFGLSKAKLRCLSGGIGEDHGRICTGINGMLSNARRLPVHQPPCAIRAYSPERHRLSLDNCSHWANMAWNMSAAKLLTCNDTCIKAELSSVLLSPNTRRPCLVAAGCWWWQQLLANPCKCRSRRISSSSGSQLCVKCLPL